MGGDVVAGKVASIERCLARVREETAEGTKVLDDQTVQDAVVLNIQRACEQAIDLATHVVSVRRLGIATDGRHAFDLLAQASAIPPALAERMKRMVGFRNVAVHEYQRLDRAILESIIHERLGDFIEFAAAIVRA
ncbi:MAG: DUF86 domain-containing protein [Phycisphaerales bacterium]